MTQNGRGGLDVAFSGISEENYSVSKGIKLYLP